MARLVDEDTEYLQLFYDVLPAFIEALPPRPSAAPANNRKQETLKNLISILRFEMQQMQQILTKTHTEYDLMDEDIFKVPDVSDALEDVLFCLEGLVNKVTNDNLDSCTSFPKLVSLKYRMLDHHPSLALNLATQYPEEVLSSISYGREGAHYRRTIRVAQNFNKIMGSIYDSHMAQTESQIPQIFQQEHHQQEDSSSNIDIATAEIHQARILRDTTKAVFDILTGDSKPCQAPHSALIHLSGFGQPEIDMIISLCVENDASEAAKKWHQVCWTSSIQPNACLTLKSSAENICAALKKARKFKSRLRILIQKDGSWKCADVSTTDRMKSYIKPPNQTLEELLSMKQDSSGGKLFKRDKLDLALAMARSLLHLSGSPLLQGQWNAENIYVTQAADEGIHDGLRTKPYIAGKLSNEVAKEETDNVSQASRFVLDLAVLLWQLLFGQKVTIEPEDEEDEDEDDPSLSLFNALNREHGNSQELFIEKPCLDIIANCLNLYSLYQLDEQTFREKIYWDIVTPLKKYLEFFYQCQGPPPHLDRPKKLPLSTNRTLAQSNPKLSEVSHMDRQRGDSLRKGAMLKNARNVTIQAREAVSLQPSCTESNLLAFSGNVKNSSTWLHKFSLVNQRLETLPQGGIPPVRVVVLDTGCDIYHEYFDGPGVGQNERLEGHWLDCVDGSDELLDEDPGKHGTAMLTLLLRLLPNAEIFVARVARNKDDLATAQHRIAKAIRYAAQEPWNVDIVSLSFGFTESAPCIEEAISYAEILKGGRILFFAAANNQGRNQKEMFPAWSESVISIRGTNHDGAFIPRYNPDTWPHNRGTELYGTISEDVSCDWTCGQLVKSGCSVATPIAAAIAAAIIQFTRCKATCFIHLGNLQELIRTRRGMLSVFNVMTEDQEQARRYLAPWQLFEGDDVNSMNTVHKIGHALSRLPRQGAQ